MKNDRGWSEHEQAQLQRWKALSPEQRLRWLEETKRFAHEAMQQAKRRAFAASADVTVIPLADEDTKF